MTTISKDCIILDNELVLIYIEDQSAGFCVICVLNEFICKSVEPTKVTQFCVQFSEVVHALRKRSQILCGHFRSLYTAVFSIVSENPQLTINSTV